MTKIPTYWAGIVLSACLVGTASSAEPQPSLRLVRKVPLPGVEGRIDHMAVDISGRRLFVAALGNNTVEIVDLAAGRRIHTIAELPEPQGIVYLDDVHQIAVASAGDGSCRFFDDQTYRPVGRLDFGNDADNVRYDSRERLLYVGYGDGAIGRIDVRRIARTTDISVGAHPESFQLERRGPRIFVNVAKAGHVAVLDRQSNTVKTTWPLTAAKANFPMALDEDNARLFVVARNPPKLVVLDTATGQELTAIDCVGDADDVFYDAARKRVYVSGGEGAISIAQRITDRRYEHLSRVPTAAGARTSLFVPQTQTLYLAVPHRGQQPAGIWVYQTPHAGDPPAD